MQELGEPMDDNDDEDMAEPMDVDAEEDVEICRGAGRDAVEASLRQRVFVEHFPRSAEGPGAGDPVDDESSAGNSRPVDVRGSNPYAPFVSQLDWKVARWAKLRGQGSTAMSELLSIPGVSGCLAVYQSY